MKVFSPAFQGTALPKDVKTALRRAESKQKTNKTVGGVGRKDYFWFPEDGPGILGVNWALFQTQLKHS